MLIQTNKILIPSVEQWIGGTDRSYYKYTTIFNVKFQNVGKYNKKYKLYIHIWNSHQFWLFLTITGTWYMI